MGAYDVGPYDVTVSPTSEPIRKKRPTAKLDRAVAMGIWVLTGLLFGLALGIFTDHRLPFLGIGLVVGILLAVVRTRPTQQIEQD